MTLVAELGQDHEDPVGRLALELDVLRLLLLLVGGLGLALGGAGGLRADLWPVLAERVVSLDGLTDLDHLAAVDHLGSELAVEHPVMAVSRSSFRFSANGLGRSSDGGAVSGEETPGCSAAGAPNAAPAASADVPTRESPIRPPMNLLCTAVPPC